MRKTIATKLSEIDQLIVRGKYNPALDMIDAIYDHEKITIEEKIQCKIFKASIYLIIFPYSKGIQFAEEAYFESKEIENKVLIFDSLNLLPRAYFIAGEFELIKEKSQLVRSVLESFENKDSDDYLKRKAVLSLLQGQRYYTPLSDIEKGLAIAERLGIDRLKIDSYISLGSRHLWSGNLTEALHYAKIALELCQDIHYHYGEAMLHNQIAVIYLQQGELSLSKEHILKGLDMCSPEEMSPYYEACLLLNLGTIQWFKSDLNKALAFYQKASILLKESEIVKTYHYPVSLSRISSVLVELGNNREVLDNIKQIEELYLSTGQHIVKKILHLTKAIYLKSKNIEPDINEAISLLEEFADDPIAYLDLNCWIVFHLCDLYLKKVTEFGDLQSYDKLKHRVNTLRQMAEHDKSHILLAQSLLLQSKLELIDFNMENGQLLLRKAQKIAEDKGITNLAKVISGEYDILLDQLSRWQEMSTYIPSLEERFEFTHIEDLLEKMIRNNALYEDIQDEKEQPHFFMIMNKVGTILFSERFSGKPLNNDLLQGIQNIIHECMCNEGFHDTPIIRMKFQHYTVAISFQEDVLLIYVFIGRSYNAIQKLYFLENEISSLTQRWSQYYRKFQSNQALSPQERMKISKTLEETFA
ncbi:MAG: hypothetical protein GOP50_00795 [Candidatus Heimdallarchaeota archaeon]|nr:hypothetical protein [Candidatus Heimdallarchaeota archaeon]